MTRVLGTVGSWIVGFARFWYRFIVGDDWTVAAAVAAGLIATKILTNRGLTAWWLVPGIVVVMVFLSVRRSRPPTPAGAHPAQAPQPAAARARQGA